MPLSFSVFIGLALRILLPVTAFLFTQDFSIFSSPDTDSYLQLAQNLISTGQFGMNASPEIVRTPGYPIFLIPGLWVNHVASTTIGLQILLSCIAIVLVYKLSLLLFEKENIARVSAFLFAVEPLNILYASKLLPEALFTTTVLLYLYFLIRCLRQNEKKSLFISALFLSLSVYIRPISYFLPVITALILFIFFLVDRPRYSLISILIFLMTCAGLIGVWQFRNKKIAGYTKFSAIQDINLYFYQGASVLAKSSKTPFYEKQNQMGYRDEKVYLHQHSQQVILSQGERYRKMGVEGLKILYEHPLSYAVIHLKGMARVLLDPAAVEYLKFLKCYPSSGGLLGKVVDQGLAAVLQDILRTKPLVFWSHVFFGFFLFFYLFLSVIALLNTNLIYDKAFVMLLAVALYFWGLSGGPNGLGRFRHPFMPVICIWAGWGLIHIRNRFRNLRGL